MAMLLVQGLLTLTVVMVLSFVGVPLWSWLLVFAAATFGLHYLSFGSVFLHLLVYLFFIVILAFSLIPLRRRFLTAKLMPALQRVLPLISPTEQAALDVGDVYWEGALFSGLPNWQQLTAKPQDKLTADEQSFLDNQVNTLCAMIDEWQLRQDDDLSPETWKYIKKEKFFGIIIPKQYGGLEFSALAHSTVVARLCSRSLAAAINVMVPNSLGPAELLLHYGTEQQKQHYLPKLANGQEIPCFALTSTEAGSDAGSMPDIGKVCRQNFQGKDTLGIRLNFDKRYITLAPVATVLGLAFKLQDDDELLGKGKEIGITLALIPTDHPGIAIGKRHNPVLSAFMNGPVRGKDVFIPMEWVIGGVEQVGFGWRMLMECLSVGRGISLPALSTAIGIHCYRLTGAYARIRKQFNLPIGQFEGVQEKLARMGGYSYLLEACRLMTVDAIGQNIKPAIASAISKYHMTEMARTLCNDAMDIQAGKGIIEGPKNYLGNFYRGIPVAITVEGSNILTRNLMIFGQGAVRAHPYVLKEIQALRHPDQKKGLFDFDKVLWAHVGYSLSNLTRTFVLTWTRGWYSPQQRSSEAQVAFYQRHMSRLSAAFAFTADAAMLVLGGDLKRRERLSARLGDVLSYLFLASAACRYYLQQGSAKVDGPYLRWALAYCLYKAENALHEFFINFPNRTLAIALQCLIFPFGRRMQMPTDEEGRLIAESMLEDSEIRRRLSRLYYDQLSLQDEVATVEKALQQLLKVEPLLNKIAMAVREGKINKQVPWSEQLIAAESLAIVTAAEVAQLQAYEELRLQVIHVDEFSAENIKGS